MSGHSKWHNIKLRKGKADAARGKIFTKITREIIVAAKAGGGNPDTNLRLRMAVQKAREASMPADNIKRGIQRGTGELAGVNYEEVTYEGYGPAGVAFLIQTLTDNRNRTVTDLRSVFNKRGGGLGEAGSVAWMFTPKGTIMVDGNGLDEETVMAVALDANAEDVRADDGCFEILTAPADLERVKAALQQQGIAFTSAELSMIPQNTVTVTGKQVEQVIRLMDDLEELDDVQRVYANFDIPDDLLEQAA
jgi:YebC/PmpR family DNA-binding regulatory protein